MSPRQHRLNSKKKNRIVEDALLHVGFYLVGLEFVLCRFRYLVKRYGATKVEIQLPYSSHPGHELSGSLLDNNILTSTVLYFITCCYTCSIPTNSRTVLFVVGLN